MGDAPTILAFQIRAAEQPNASGPLPVFAAVIPLPIFATVILSSLLVAYLDHPSRVSRIREHFT